MALENPAALLLLLLTALLLFARQRRAGPRVAVGNLYLWSEASRRDAPAFVRRLRRHWLLILQLAILAAVAISVAGPTMAASDARVTLILDTSLSMGARQDGAARLELARTQAESLVERLPRRTRVRIVAAGSTPRVIGEFAASEDAVVSAIRSVTATDAAADLAAAINYARAAGGPAQRIYVFSDGNGPASTSALANVEWSSAGTPADNAAITNLSARLPPGTSDTIQVLAAVTNYGRSDLNALLTLARGQTEVARQVVSLRPRGQAAYAFTLDGAEGILTARLQSEDALSADNLRRLILPQPETIRVLLRQQTGYFLERALSVHPGITFARSEAEEHDVIVCDGCSELPAGDAGVLLIPPRAVAGQPQSALVNMAARHPVAAGLEIDGVLARVVAHDRLPEGSIVIAQAAGLPAIVAYETEEQRVVEVRLDPDEAQFPLSTAFPVLVSNAVQWLARHDGRREALTAGEPLQLRLPGSRQEPLVLGPDSQPVRSTFTGGHLSVVETSTAGIYRVRVDGGDLAIAVNPAVDGESDLTVSSTPSTIRGAGASSGGREHADVTVLFVLAALLLLALEWRLRHAGRRLA